MLRRDYARSPLSRQTLRRKKLCGGFVFLMGVIGTIGVVGQKQNRDNSKNYYPYYPQNPYQERSPTPIEPALSATPMNF